jgi:hypothetical protein
MPLLLLLPLTSGLPLLSAMTVVIDLAALTYI